MHWKLNYLREEAIPSNLSNIYFLLVLAGVQCLSVQFFLMFVDSKKYIYTCYAHYRRANQALLKLLLEYVQDRTG